MKLSTFAKRFPIYADQHRRNRLSIELISSPGRGKSQTVSGLAGTMSELEGEEWGYSDLFLATQTPPDLIGFQFKGEIEVDGRKMTITDPTAPTWFVTRTGKPVFSYKRGILFLDEFGQGQTDVKAAAAELLLHGRIGKWALPDGWIVIAASNRTSDRSGVTKSLDFVINRRMEIHLTDDLDELLNYGTNVGWLPTTLAFVASNPGVVLTEGVPEKQGPWPTPRTMEMVDEHLQACMRHGDGTMPVNTEVVEEMSGLIGAGAAGQYMAFIRLEKEMPKYERIVADPMGVKVPEKPDARMLVAYHLAHRVTATDVGKVIKYIERMPPDFHVIFLKTACKRDSRLIAIKEIQDWCMANSALMTATSI